MQADTQHDSEIASPAANEPRDAGNASAQGRASALPSPEKDQTLGTTTKAPTVSLPTLGEGFDAGVNDATNRVEIRRRALPTYSFANDHAIDVFAAQRKLSEVDREALHSLELVAEARRRRMVADVANVLAESAEENVRDYAWVTGKSGREQGASAGQRSMSPAPEAPAATRAPADGHAPDSERLTARDGAIGAAHAAQVMQVSGPLAHTAVQAVGIADAAKIASDVAQGREVRALDVASASASVAMTTGMGGPAVQLASQGVTAVSAVDAGRRAMNTVEDKVSEAVDAQTPSPLPRIQLNGQPWMNDRLGASRDLGDRIGVTADIERLSYDGRVAEQIVKTLGDRLAPVRRTAELNNESPDAAARDFVRDVRTTLGVASQEDREDFAQWRKGYEARQRPHDAAGQTSAAAAPANADKPVPEQQMSTVVANSIEHVSARELPAESPDTAELRKRLLAERSTTGPETSSSSPSKSRPDAVSAPATSTEAAREKEARDRETIERMTRPELDEYAAARKVSEERVDQVLRAAQRRIEAETDRPGVRAYPPLEERFNIKRHLLRRDFEFRDQPGKVAFTERWLSMKSTTHSAAVVKAMVDRAEERGWTAVRVKGSAEFERQVWISATARGIKALGYEPTDGDRLAMAHERERLNAERGQAHSQNGGTITRETTREREMPAWADPNARGLRDVPGDIPRDVSRRPGFARRAPAPDRPAPVPREPAIARALRPLLVERGESAEDIAAIVAVAGQRLQHDRVYVGKVLDHGPAPYQFDDKNTLNYFLKLHTPSGEKTVWSVDLARALEESSIKVGDSIALEHRGVTPVSVAVTDRDAAGRIVGSHDEVVDRNTWYAANVEQLRAEALDRSASDRKRSDEADLGGEGTAKPTVAKPTQAVEQRQQTEPRSHARDALVFEALEAAFAAKNVPADLRDGLRKNVQKELDLRSARGEAVEVGVFDPGAARQIAPPVRVPQRQPQAHDRSR